MRITHYDSTGAAIGGTAGGGILTTKGDLLTHDGTEQVRLPVGANGGMLVANSAAADGIEWQDIPQIVRVSDTKPQNTAQATYTAGAYRTMDLNTKDYDPAGIASIAIGSNQVTLPTGKYHAVAVSVLLAGAISRINFRLYNATTATEITGTESINVINSASIRSWITLNAAFTLAATSAIEVQVYSDVNTTGIGTLNRSGKSEVYLTVTFIRISQL